MKARVIFVERKPSDSVSIERVFRQIAKDLPADRFDLEFQSVPYANGVFAILRNLLFFRKNQADIYHITGDIHYIALLLPGNRTVLTIHDIVALHRRSGIRRAVLKKLFLDWPLRRIDHVTTVSAAVKAEIVEEAGRDGDKVVVIDDPLRNEFIAGDTRPFNQQCPVILHIGTAENKNLANLVSAVAGLKCKLRIVGRLDDKITESLRLNDTLYENVFGLDESEMLEEYRNADIVSFCSTYEGFGLPIIEAQAMRRPVITSDMAPMNFVAGGGAALADPYDVSSIRSGLMRLMSDPEYRNELIEAGTENIKRFEGKAIARRYSEIYDEILGQAK